VAGDAIELDGEWAGGWSHGEIGCALRDYYVWGGGK
jgi:hypothetical protein